MLKFAAIFALGFAIAWWAKPTSVGDMDALASPRPHAEDHGFFKQAAPRQLSAQNADFRRRWEQADGDQREELLASLMPGEFPILLKQVKENAGIYEMTWAEKELLETLVATWHARAPDAALAWVHSLPSKDDQSNLLAAIVNEVMETDLPAALALLRQEAADRHGRVEIPSSVLQSAASLGAEELVAFCRLGGGSKSVSSGYPLNYPDGFDFKLALDRLVAERSSLGKEEGYVVLPNNLMSAWARMDPQAAWEWLQNNEPLNYNEPKEFFAAHAATLAASSEEIGRMLASDFEQDANSEAGYDNAWAALDARPSAEMLESFLQSVPGDRAVHLDALFDNVWGVLCPEQFRIQVCGLLLERMTPERRMGTLRRNNPYLLGEEKGRAFGPILRRLGHSQEEIGSVLPALRKP